jgi:hypothetical protein
MSRELRPLVHIGYHKCASSWLQEVLFHPEHGYYSPWQPGVYFEELIHANPFTFDPANAILPFVEGLHQARIRNLVPVLSNEALSGNQYEPVFPAKDTADRLKLVFPEARILMVIREQGDMLFSWYKHCIRSRLSLSLHDYFDSSPPSGFAPPFRREMLEYHLLIGYYQDLFGRENVLVLPVELLRRNALGFVNAIGSMVGIPAYCQAPSAKPVNEAMGGLAVSWFRHWNRLTGADRTRMPWRRRRIDRLGTRLFWHLNRIIPQRLHSTKDEAMRLEIRTLLGDYYVSSNRRTQELTGQDLAALGYRT